MMLMEGKSATDDNMSNNAITSESHSDPPKNCKENNNNSGTFESATGAGEDSIPQTSHPTVIRRPGQALAAAPRHHNPLSYPRYSPLPNHGLRSAYSTIHAQKLSMRSAKRNDRERIQSNPTGPEKKVDSSIANPEELRQHRERRIEAMATTLSSWIEIECQKQNQDSFGSEANIANLLRDFASRFGFEGSSKACLEAMIFIHQYSTAIAAVVQARVHKYQKKDSQHGSTRELVKNKVMTFEEKIANWSPSQEPRSLGEQDPRNSAFYKLVSISRAFIWLQDRIRKLVDLTYIESAANAIANAVVKQIPHQYGAAWGISPECCWFEIRVNWDLSTFVREQTTVKERGAEEAETISLEHVEHTITITGSATNAQALTCGEYLEQIWPRYGTTILQLIKLAAQNPDKEAAIRQDTGTLTQFSAIKSISAHQSPDYLLFRVAGELHACAEMCEILAWITSALQASPFGPKVCACEPFFSVAPRENGALSRQPRQICVNIDIDFTLKQLKGFTPGSCWHDMFNNPVVVTGYPILRRAKVDTGLEMSLGIVSAVLRTQRITMIDNRIYIKAFSAMLIPIEQVGDTILWHYIYAASGNYLQYSQDSVEHATGIRPEALAKYRCIVGYCSEAKLNAGSPNASLSIEESGLDPPTQSFALKGFSISGGQFISLAGTVTIGNKDPSLRIAFVGKPIVDKLEWISKQFVVLWDCGEDRGWLVDGLSALLYMIRVYLNERRNSLFGPTLLLEPEDIYEPTEPYPLAAARFFWDHDWKNMKLKLSFRRFEDSQEHVATIETQDSTQSKEGQNQGKGKTTFVYLQDRVEDLLETLFYTIELQTKLAEREGIYYKGHLRKHLEGWDFIDLATNHFQFQPVAKKFPCTSVPWIDLVRSINAIVLFGRGFGEIIEPADPGSVCSHWAVVPKGQNYLCACVKTLQSMMKRHNGYITSNAVNLTSKYVWHNPNGNFVPCTCRERVGVKPQNCVQIIWPSSLPSISSQRQAPLQSDGAVVFGTHSTFRWFRGYKGEAVLGLPPDDEAPKSPAALATIDEDSRSLAPTTNMKDVETSTHSDTDGSSNRITPTPIESTSSNTSVELMVEAASTSQSLQTILRQGKRKAIADTHRETPEPAFWGLKRRARSFSLSYRKFSQNDPPEDQGLS